MGAFQSGDGEDAAANRGLPSAHHSSIHVTATLQSGNVERIDAEGVQQPTPPPLGFEGTTVLRDLESIASPNLNLQKRVTNSASNIPSTSTVNHFIRRQHRKLLEKIPHHNVLRAS